MSEEKILSRIKEVFPEAPIEDLERIAGICELRSFKDKDVILKSGNKLRKVFLVLEGAARGYVIDDTGEEKTILLRGKGIFVGDSHGLFLNCPQKLNIVAVGQTEVLLFSFSEFEDLASKHPNILKIYLNSMKEAILRLNYRIEKMITMSGEERYLDLLKMNPAFLGKSYDKYVASFLGITPVSLSRIKKKISISELSNDNSKGG